LCVVTQSALNLNTKTANAVPTPFLRSMAYFKQDLQLCKKPYKGPFIYDVHTEGVVGGGTQVDAYGREGESSPMWMSTQKIKIRVH